MTELEQRIARIEEELRTLEADMRRSGLAMTPELARARRWELGRCMASLYQRWRDLLLVHHSPAAPAHRHLGRSLVHAPRPD